MNELHEKLSPWLDKLPFHWDSIKEYGKIRHLPKGEYLFHQGDESNKVYIVESGENSTFPHNDGWQRKNDYSDREKWFSR